MRHRGGLLSVRGSRLDRLAQLGQTQRARHELPLVTGDPVEPRVTRGRTRQVARQHEVGAEADKYIGRYQTEREQHKARKS